LKTIAYQFSLSQLIITAKNSELIIVMSDTVWSFARKASGL